MRRYHSPSTLHKELHQEPAQGEHWSGVRVGPERDYGYCEKSSDYDGSPAAKALRPGAKSDSAQESADVVDDGDGAHHTRREAEILL